MLRDGWMPCTSTPNPHPATVFVVVPLAWPLKEDTSDPLSRESHNQLSQATVLNVVTGLVHWNQIAIHVR